MNNLEREEEDDLKNLLAILQPKEIGAKTEMSSVTKDTPKSNKEKTDKKEIKQVVAVEKTVKTKPTVVIETKTENLSMAVKEEVLSKGTLTKVVVRGDLYEIFMSMKRIKKVKSVSTLIDYALEDYIKRNKDEIKKLLYDSKNHEIL